MSEHGLTVIGGTRAATLTPPPRQEQAAPFVVIPGDDDFEEGVEFIPAPNLQSIGRRLVDELDELRPIQRATVTYLWKRKGGKVKGKEVLGKCQKPSGLLAYFAETDFVVWLGADTCRSRDYGVTEIEALVFHELKHAGWEIDEKTGEVRWVVVGHDAELFRDEIKRFGAWHVDAQRMTEAFRQAGLFEAQSA